MKKIITRTAYLLSFLIISTPVYLFLFFDINNYKKEITKYVSAKTNYNFRYEGKLSLNLLFPTIITIPNIEIRENTSLDSSTLIIQIAEAKLSVSLNELLDGIINVDEISAKDFIYHGINVDDILMKTYSILKFNSFSSLDDNTTSFETISAIATIVDEKMVINSIYMETGLLEMKGVGSINLSTKDAVFEMTGNLKNKEKLRGKYYSNYPSELSGEELPIKMSGKMDNLSISINFNKILKDKLKPISNDVMDKLKDKVIDELKEKLRLPF